jgi:hypothetical protein
MNDGRRQLFAPPKQLLQPGAAARLPRTIRRHRVRHMIGISTTAGPATARGRTRCVVRDDAYQTLAHDPQHGRTGETISQKNFSAGRSPRRRPCRRGMTVAIAPARPFHRPCGRHDSPPQNMSRRPKTRATVEDSQSMNSRVAAQAGLPPVRCLSCVFPLHSNLSCS